jgi:hypothetical protein
MLVKRHLTIPPTTKTNHPRMKKTTPPFFAVLFFLLTIGFIYFTMMPQMTSEEEGPWLNSQR